MSVHLCIYMYVYAAPVKPARCIHSTLCNQCTFYMCTCAFMDSKPIALCHTPCTYSICMYVCMHVPNCGNFTLLTNTSNVISLQG